MTGYYHVTTDDLIQTFDRNRLFWLCRNPTDWWPEHLPARELNHYAVWTATVVPSPRVKQTDCWTTWRSWFVWDRRLDLTQLSATGQQLAAEHWDWLELTAHNDQNELQEICVINTSTVLQLHRTGP